MRRSFLLLWSYHVLLWHLSLTREQKNLPTDRCCQDRLYLENQAKNNAEHGERGFLTSEGQRRKLRQSNGLSTSDFDCRLTQRKIARILDVDVRTWSIDDAVWADIEEDLQEIVNCSDEGDALLFDVSDTLQPARRVTLPWSLTLSTTVRDRDLVDGIFPETRRKTAFRCPSSNSGVFRVQSQNALFANLVFEDCSLVAEDAAAIVEVNGCEVGESQSSIQLHHVEFRQNRLNRTVALRVSEESCASLVMNDVGFVNNTCSGICGAVLSRQNALTGLRLRGNTQLVVSSLPAILYAPPNSQTTLKDVTAADNYGPLVYVKRGDLKMTNASFQRNTAGESEESDAYGAGVYVDRSTATIRRCRFEDSTAPSGSGVYAVRSSVAIRDSRFIRNEGILGGAAVYLDRCLAVDVRTCTFAENLVAELNGAGIFSNATKSLSVRNSVFLRNAAGNGAAVYVVGGKLDVIASEFESNTANVSAGAVFVDDASLTLESTSFSNNTAKNLGGAVHVRQSSQASVRYLTCRNCSAATGGCMHFMQTSFTLNDSFVYGNSALTSGGGIATENSEYAHISRCVFRGNFANRGGGAEISAAESNIQDTEIASNRANASGAGYDIRGGVFSFSNCTFERNTVEGYGGGLTCAENGRLAVRDTVFQNNTAEQGGGGSAVTEKCEAVFHNVTWKWNNATTLYGGGCLVNGGVATYQDSVFEQNRAESGGGVGVDDSRLTFARVDFRNNAALDSGGGFFSNNATTSIEDALFANNSAGFGGAMHFDWMSVATNVRRTHVAENCAKNDGGGAMLTKALDVRLSDSMFVSNRASRFGGCIAVEQMSAVFSNLTIEGCLSDRSGAGIAALFGSRVTITASSIRRSNATNAAGAIVGVSAIVNVTDSFIFACAANNSGGAFFLEGASSVANIQSSNISNNFARNGGAVYLSGSRLFGENVTLHRNTADNFGGGVMSLVSSFFRLTRVSLIQNRALVGAGIFLTDGGNGTLVDCFAYNNSVDISGGTAYTGDRSNLTVLGGRFEENKARHGGAFVVINARLQLINISVVNGSATNTGGAVHASRDSIVTVSRSDFLSNRAELGGGVHLEQAYFWGREARFAKCKATMDGGAINANIVSSVMCSDCVFDENVAVNKGGAVNINSRKTQLLAYQFDNCTFSNNRGVLGGGLHFVSRNKIEDCAAHDAKCSFVALQDTRFVNNQASSAGGAVLSSDLNAIRVSCRNRTRSKPLEYLKKPAFESMNTLNATRHVCQEWTHNTAGGYGDTVASYAHRIRKKIRYEDTNVEEEIEGNRYVVRNHVSGTQIPRLSLETVDALGQGPAPGTDNATIVATMSSPDGLFTGFVSVRMDNGVGRFSGVAGYREAGFYRVRVDFSERSIPSFTIVVEIRGCVIGEAIVANGTICQPCIGDTYNFFPETSDIGCASCPENANCDGVFILPDDGYWHQTPCSDNIQECLTKRACDADNRKEDMRRLQDSVEECHFTEAYVRSYVDSECRKGYTGPLCGSCAASYGRSNTFHCEPCRSGIGSFVLAMLSVVMLLVLSAFAIHSSISSGRRTPDVASPRLRSPPKPSTSAGVSDRPPIALPPVNLEMIEMLHKGHSPSEILETFQSQQQQQQQPPSPSSSSSLTLTLTTPRQTEEDELLAKWKAVEIFKITINYLQVIAVAISVNVDWTEALIALFETAEFLGGLATEAAARSVDCLVPENSAIPRSAVRTVVSIMVPMLVTGLYFILWAFALLRANETLSYLTKRCVLSFMAVSYLSYIAITKTAVNVLSCVAVYDSLLVGSDTTTKYWQVDTSLQCYRGTHAMLAGLVGWPVLIAFSIGFPVFTAALLMAERHRHDMESEWLFEATGFMYRAYKKKYVYWESAIMLRKAVLALVVVFSYALGANLQGILGVCVLMLALYFHIVCQPFRSEFAELNEYEGLSLLVCALTFVSGLCFNDERTIGWIRVSFTVSLVLVNVGIILFFAIAFFRAGCEYLRIALEAEGIDYDAEKGSLHVVRVYVHSRLQPVRHYLFSSA